MQHINGEIGGGIGRNGMLIDFNMRSREGSGVAGIFGTDKGNIVNSNPSLRRSFVFPSAQRQGIF
jgi:hypothetical protein